MPDAAVPLARRRRLAPQQRMQQVVQEATRLIAERGWRGLALQDVADACGLTVAGLLHHVGSRDGVLIAVLEHRDAVDRAEAAHAAAESPDPRAEVDAFVERNSRQPEVVRLYSVLAAESLDPSHPAHAYFARRYADSRRHLAGVLRGHVADADATAVQVLAAMDGLQLQWLRDTGGFDLEEHWRAVRDKLLR